MNKYVWQFVVATVVLVGGFGVVRCYGDRRYERGRREAEIAHSDSSRLWIKRGADSVSRIADQQVTILVRTIDSLHAEAARIGQEAGEAQARYRQAASLLAGIPKATLGSADRRVVAVLDSMGAANRDLDAVVVSLTTSNNQLLNQLVADSVAMRKLQESRDRWKTAYDTAATEIRQLKAVKTPKPKRFGFKWGLVTGIVATVGALIAAVSLSH